MSAPISGARNFHMIEAVPERFEGAPRQFRRRWSDDFKERAVAEASHPIDFRKGPDSLLSLVRDAGSDPFNGALYVFRAKRADCIKIVWGEGSAVCL